MAYNNRRNYNGYGRNSYGRNSYSRSKVRVSKRARNRVIIIAVGIIIFALIVTLISSVISCICTGSPKTELTIDTATVGKATKATKPTKPVEKPKADNLIFKEPNIKDSGSDSSGTLNNGYYIWNSKAFEAFKGSKSDAKAYADFVNKVKDKLGLGVNVYSAIVPTHIEMGLPNKYKNTEGGIKTNSQADYIKAVYKNYSKKIKYINSYNLLSDHCNDYIYFDSDKSPTGLGGYYVYKSFNEVMGKKPIELNACKESAIKNFYGSYNNFTDAELKVDTVNYWDFSYNMSNTITNEDDTTDTVDSCYNKDAESGAGAYNVFLYGKKPLEIIKSESDRADGKIAIIHNSAANSIVPYFTYNYEEVYSINYGLYEGSLKNLIAENDIRNVLFINDTISSADSETLDSLKELTGVK